jgi:iron-regulated transporter 1
MRRIDLFCKLIAPVVVSLMDGLLSTRVAIWAVLGINVAVVLIEYFAIAQVSSYFNFLTSITHVTGISFRSPA